MPRTLKSSDVLDANAITKLAIRCEVIGTFEPTGPNKWDDWELNTDEVGQELEIGPQAKIQVESLGANPEIRLRFRQGRKVLRLKWLPTEADREELATGRWGVQEAEQATVIERIFNTGPSDDPRDDMLEYFFEVIAEPYSAEAGMGWEAMLIKKLRGS